MVSLHEQMADGRIPSGAAKRSRFYKKLYVQVLIAVALGAALGYFYPQLGTTLKPYGDAFVKAIGSEEGLHA